MKVKAKELGYYGDKRRKEGAIFHIKSEKFFSEKWMIDVDGVLPKKGEESSPEKPVKKSSPKVSKKSASKKAPVKKEAKSEESEKPVVDLNSDVI